MELPFASTLIISSMSLAVKQGGFSQKTCLPARKAFKVYSLLKAFGVQIITASTSLSFMISTGERFGMIQKPKT